MTWAERYDAAAIEAVTSGKCCKVVSSTAGGDTHPKPCPNERQPGSRYCWRHQFGV